jgi:hypothetical protein
VIPVYEKMSVVVDVMLQLAHVAALSAALAWIETVVSIVNNFEPAQDTCWKIRNKINNSTPYRPMSQNITCQLIAEFRHEDHFHHDQPESPIKPLQQHSSNQPS